MPRRNLTKKQVDEIVRIASGGKWERSRIRCQPYVSKQARNRKGKTYERSVEDMLKVYRRRRQKSGIDDELRKRRYYKKPSESRHEEKKRIAYENEKRNERRKERERKMTQDPRRPQ